VTWYTVEVVTPPSHYTASIMEYAKFLMERQDWCEKHVGRHGVSWDNSTTSERRRIYRFKDSKDALWFAMRWS
jgi:hypothetical protein